MRGLAVSRVVTMALTLQACSALPFFDNTPGSPNTPAPTVDDIVQHVECEIWRAQKDFPDIKTKLAAYGYVASADLTLAVQNNQGVNVNLGFVTSPLHGVASDSFTLFVGPTLSGQQHRDINLTFSIDLEAADEARAQEACTSAERDAQTGKPGLRGDLGLGDIMVAGLKHVGARDFIFSSTFDAYTTQQKLSAPTFGSTIDFEVVYGLSNTGPHWNLEHFKGPGPADDTGGPLTFTRTLRDTLVVSFAPSKVPASGNVPEYVGSKDFAGKAAQDSNTKLILEELIPVIP
jgi:hypothetical protein